MKRFAALFAELDESTSTHDKVAALVRYLGDAPPEDAAWAMYFLAGGKPRQIIRTAQLKAVAMQAAGLPEWLFEASYATRRWAIWPRPSHTCSPPRPLLAATSA
jgi:DNA ligase-1